LRALDGIAPEGVRDAGVLYRAHRPARYRPSDALSSRKLLSVKEPLATAVDVQAAAAEEADQRLVGRLGEVTSQAGRRRHCHQDRNPGLERFLDDLEGGASADHQDVAVEGQEALTRGVADDFVHRVVPADVLAHDDRLAIQREQPGRVQAAGPSEDRLFFPQSRVEAIDHLGIDRELIVRKRRRRLVDRLDAAHPAQPAARGRQEVALPALIHAWRRWRQLDIDDIFEIRVLAVRDDREGGHVVGRANDALPEEKAEREVAVVARGPHHQGQRLAADTDFQWLLGGELIVHPGAGLAAVAKDPRAMRAAVLHWTILANGLPAIRYRSAAEGNVQPRAYQEGLDAAVEGNQPVLRQRQPLGLLVGLDGIVPGQRGSALVERLLQAIVEEPQVVELR